MRATISILCCNRLDQTKRCITSVLENTPEKDIEILLTDNGSTDITGFYLLQLKDPRVQVIYHKKNLGFILGNEHALTLAKGDYFVMLNNDMIVEQDWLKHLLKEFSDSAVKLAGSHSSMIPGSKWYFMKHDEDDFDYIEGCCVAVPTKFIKEFGLFNKELLIAYGEDSDLSLRLRKAGYLIKKAKDCVVHHINGPKTMDVMKLDRDALHKNNHTVFMKNWGYYLEDRKL